MTRLPVTSFLAAMMVAVPVTAWAADACCPTEAAKTGATVRTVADQAAPQGQQGGKLPPGHPPMGGSGGGMGGGMGGGAGGGMGGMPSGHPQVPGMNDAAASTPFTAALVVKVVQGTKDAKLPADLPVTVDFYQGGKVIHQAKGTVNDQGMAMLENIALPGSAQPLITVEHGGVRFQSAGKPMTSQVSDQMVRVNIFEVTEQAPQWEVAMRHVMIEPTTGALKVSEVIAVRNPTDRVWLGNVMPAAEGYDGPQRLTMKLTVPQGARHVTLGRGFHPEFSRGDGRDILIWTPMLPGASEFHYNYVVAAKDGVVDLSLDTPAITRSMMLFVPDSVQSSSEAASKVFPAGDKQMRLYEWKDLASGKVASVKLEGLGTLAPATKPTPKAEGGSMPESQAQAQGPAPHLETGEVQQPSAQRGARALAGLGAGALVLGGAVVMLVKPRKTAR